MTNHTTPAIITLLDTFVAKLPPYLEQQIRDAKVVWLPIAAGELLEDLDFAATFPQDVFTVDEGCDETLDGTGGVYDGYRYAPMFGAASAWLLTRSALFAAGALFDAIVGDDLDGSAFQEPFTSRFDVEGLYGWLPTPVVEWLDEIGEQDAVAWLMAFMAEFEMHRARLLAGEFPQPHCTGSEMALYLIIGGVADLVEDIMSCDPTTVKRAYFEALGGHDGFVDLAENLFDALFEDGDVFYLNAGAALADMAMRTPGLHPANWFEPFRDDKNPWLAPLQ